MGGRQDLELFYPEFQSLIGRLKTTTFLNTYLSGISKTQHINKVKQKKMPQCPFQSLLQSSTDTVKMSISMLEKKPGKIFMEERELPLIYDSEEKKADKAYIKARTVKKPEGFFKVYVEGNRKLLADAILSAFIGEPEFAGNFLDSLFLNLNSAVKKNAISLHTQEEETNKVLYKFANNRQTAVLF